MNEWREVTWGDISKLKYGKGLQGYKEKTEGVPVFGTNGQVGFTDSALCESSGVIIGRKGAYRGVHYSSKPFYVIDTAYWLAPGEMVYPQWAYYNLKTVDINGLDSGSAIPSLSRTDFESLPCLLPEIDEQKAIAHILGTLDDKIELNQKMTQTLEDIAKAIFKSWFVDFDPVRAKAEDRPTGLPPEISDLFPDELVDSEIGELPKGWAVSTLGDLVTPKKGKSITKKKVVKGNVPVVAGGLSPAYYHNSSNVKAPTVTISASGANAGFARLYNEDIWASDCSYISKEQTPFVFLWYVFLKIHQDKIFHMQQGAAQPHIYPSDLMRLQLAYPDSDELWYRALDLISPMFLRIGNADKESAVLSELRDTLLPKLISGELRIPDAQKFLEEAGI